MSDWTETHRAFVNTWECDENDHMNVQFYLKRFDQAARIFFAMTNNFAATQGLPVSRHVRYHSELRPGALTRICSGRISDGQFAGWTVHRLEDKGANQLAATALDAPFPGQGRCRIPHSTVALALPRGLASDHLNALPPDQITDRGGLISHRSIVTPAECDSSGEVAEQFYVSRFTDAAPHVWENAGIGESWLTSHGYGRAAVEMKITHHQQSQGGDMLFVYSYAEIAGRKTIKLHHEVIRQPDQTAVVTCEVLALILDLKTRKSVPLPGEFG